MKHCGYIALIGAPNAGKSTLLNAILRKKISIVSQKPHTTRDRILGILTHEQTQLLFLDTPGFTGTKSISSIKNKTIPWEACEDANLICYLIDVTRGWKEDDSKHLKKLLIYQKPILILGTKTDKHKKQAVLAIQQEFQEHIKNLNIQASCSMISAKKTEDIAFLVSEFAKYMPQSEWLYEHNSVTDSSDKFMCAEFIREQIFRQLGDELPYQAIVIIDKFENSTQLVDVYATIVVVRESHKPILIGRGGSRLKKIGQLSRETLEKHFNKKVFLKIFVKKGDI